MLASPSATEERAFVNNPQGKRICCSLVHRHFVFQCSVPHSRAVQTTASFFKIKLHIFGILFRVTQPIFLPKKSTVIDLPCNSPRKPSVDILEINVYWMKVCKHVLNFESIHARLTSEYDLAILPVRTCIPRTLLFLVVFIDMSRCNEIG